MVLTVRHIMACHVALPYIATCDVGTAPDGKPVIKSVHTPNTIEINIQDIGWTAKPVIKSVHTPNAIDNTHTHTHTHAAQLTSDNARRTRAAIWLPLLRHRIQLATSQLGLEVAGTQLL